MYYVINIRSIRFKDGDGFVPWGWVRVCEGGKGVLPSCEGVLSRSVVVGEAVPAAT